MYSQADPYSERILDAARRLLREQGLRRTSLAEIAQAAEVSEATLYRRFANRDALVTSIMRRESDDLFARIDERIAAIDDPVERLLTAFAMVARVVRDSDLAQALLGTDPDHVLPVVTTRGGHALALGRRYLLAQTRSVAESGVALNSRPEEVAEVLLRLAHSLALTPDTPLALNDEESLKELARPLASVGTGVDWAR